MSEGNSRYSIIENLNKEKGQCLDMVKRINQTLNANELELSRFIEASDDAVVKKKADHELFVKQAKLDIEFQKEKMNQIDAAMSAIQKISETVERKEA